MITGLYSKMVTLLKDTLSRFIVEENYLSPSKFLEAYSQITEARLKQGRHSEGIVFIDLLGIV